ncbi:glycosyltransferase family 39 protein [Patescibacteria group bacterium]|nr:glycosyltransferase family 39 protein [Patescibacteria group bacterium]
MERNKIFKKIKSLINIYLLWIKKNPWEFVLILSILLIGSFFRLYKIDQYLTFLGDEGRDVIIVRRLLVYRDLILVGPGTSIGNMYLGPLYYYLMAPALFLANYSPVGPAVQVALLGILTIFLIYLISRQWFGIKAALASSFLYAIAPTVIIYSRSSWNPNIMPFFSIICIYSLWRVWKKEEFKWFIPLSISFAFMLQSHYLGLLLLPVFAVFYILTLLKIKIKKQKKDSKNYIEEMEKRRNLFKYSLFSLSFFVFLMSPLVIFDARHGWRNTSSMKKFFTERQTTVSARPWTAIPKVPKVTAKVFTRLLSGKNELMGEITMVILLIGVFFVFRNRKKMKGYEYSGYLLILVWLFTAFIGLGIYKQEIYDHYYGFFFPAPFMLVGYIFASVQKNLSKYRKIIVWLIFSILVLYNLFENPLKYPPNRQMQRSIEVAEKIKDEYNGQPFNLAVIAERNYEDGYQYFLEKMKLPVTDIDAQRFEETVKEQLFVVCEMEKEKCNPNNSPKAEVANFGWSKVENEWNVFGVTLYKLIHIK